MYRLHVDAQYPPKRNLLGRSEYHQGNHFSIHVMPAVPRVSLAFWRAASELLFPIRRGLRGGISQGTAIVFVVLSSAVRDSVLHVRSSDIT